MKSLKGTKTEKNLMAAFVGESAARNKYTFFASVAKKEGYEQISAIFQETADNEKEHAKRFYKFLGDATVAVDSVYSSGLADTAACLKMAAAGEHEEFQLGEALLHIYGAVFLSNIGQSPHALVQQGSGIFKAPL